MVSFALANRRNHTIEEGFSMSFCAFDTPPNVHSFSSSDEVAVMISHKYPR